MKRPTSIASQILVLFAIAFFAVSCAKEELIGPCMQQEGTNGSDLRMMGGDGEGNNEGGFGSNANTASGGNAGEEEGIGDDGDDLPDNERNRKKRVN